MVFSPSLSSSTSRGNLTGLVMCENKTVTGINSNLMGRNDQSALNHWLTDSKWSTKKLDKARKAMILEFLQARRLKRGALVVNDTISHKTGKHMEGVNIHYDHAEGRYVLGHQLVTSGPCYRRSQPPIGLRAIQEG